MAFSADPCEGDMAKGMIVFRRPPRTLLQRFRSLAAL